MLGRRAFLLSASATALAVPSLAYGSTGKGAVQRARPLPLSAVRLAPSIYADAIEANRQYLLRLDPQRLLHNFHKSAGLPPKGEIYGGWENLSIAGHTLGHYLTACALMHAQTGDTEVRDRARVIVHELAACQAAHGDGYIGGTTVEREGETIDGKIVFEEVRRGEIRTAGFDVNGGWVPLYTWHKVQAGLLDAYRLAQIPEARPVLLGMADYLATILEGLSDAQMQQLLAAEYGGLNEAFAETYALTGERRWLAVAERIRDRRVLDPLTEGRDILPGLHANTQIPKVIGLARLHELTGEEGHAAAARFFHKTVVQDHTYVIGGNSEREHFGPPHVLAPRITHSTCEACNTYNMLKLTRHLYAWDADAGHFDFYERAHLNHIMAHQNPASGMFVYFMSLASGGRRTYSLPEDSFWCCVGSGIESHSKHGDSIYWEDGSSLYVNLFIPSTLDWAERGLKLALETAYPLGEHIALKVVQAPAEPLSIGLRLPGWCAEPALALNGTAASFERRRGYALLDRRWKAGDRLELSLPMSVRTEATPDDPNTLAFLHGPLVLAADLGPAAEPPSVATPALVGSSAHAAHGALQPLDTARSHFRLVGAMPEGLVLKPFFNQYDRRTAVYFPRFGAADWEREHSRFLAEQAAAAAVEARTVDVLYLGEMQPERDHAFRARNAELVAAGGRSGRRAWWGQGNYFEVELAVPDGPAILRALYWGEEIDKNFEITVDGVRLAHERRPGPAERRFVAIDYDLPAALTRGKSKVVVRFETLGSDAPVYELRVLGPEGPST